ncbi:MAG: hypothetical protein WBQ63_18460 [Candidatus Acidiferrales bacterium]
MKRFAVVTALLLLAFIAAAAQNSQQQPPPPASPNAVAPPSTPAPAQVAPTPNPEFLQAADEVLQQMSQILHLPILEPLKKSLRSKDQIRAYLITEESDDKDDAQRYADRKALEAFGLIPKDFPLDSFMLQVLTDQVAGLYDPKAKEFYIADWIQPDEQREVMSHELTHALEDQSFHIDPWIKAARPNDDAEMARDAVSEGSAMAAMVDYALRDDKVSVRDLPDITVLMRSSALDEMDKDPNLVKAPIYIRDGLLFPYLAGASFTQQFLRAHDGWPDLKLVFQNPPVSTQQIMHPDLYLKGVAPQKIVLPEWKGLVPSDWKLLEENVMGEFGLDKILKQFIGAQRADALSPAWTGDRYAVFEDAKTKQTPDVFLLALDTAEHTGTFFGQYSEGLETKYANRTQLFRRPNFFQFQTDQGGVFLWCVDLKCLTVERSTRQTFDAIDHAIGLPPAPVPAEPPASSESAALATPAKRSASPTAMLASR